MNTKIFVNLPVQDLEKSKKFFTELGYSFNPQFTNENAACLVITEDIYAMLLLPHFFMRFTKKEIVDTKKNVEAIIALSAESREKVDELAEKALKAGGVTPREPEDLGFMYTRSFEDLDGHQWEIFWMDPAHVQ